jgi:hypothetical protein
MKINKSLNGGTMPIVENGVYEKFPRIHIEFRNGRIAELGEKTFDNDRLTLRGILDEISEAITLKKPYKSGNTWIDTSEIAFMVILNEDK